MDGEAVAVLLEVPVVVSLAALAVEDLVDVAVPVAVALDEVLDAFGSGEFGFSFVLVIVVAASDVPLLHLRLRTIGAGW